eukprot:1421680-Alexandrium_andersonii.AAC.1
MSASLVGSEMCIRDRSSRVVPRALELRIGGKPDVLRRRRAEGWGALIDVCLLYTSDAADDM